MAVLTCSAAENGSIAGLDKNIEESSQQCSGLVQLTENALPAMSRLLLASVHVNNLQSRIRFAIRRCVYLFKLIARFLVFYYWFLNVTICPECYIKVGM
jgi:hypothetical protein